MACPWFYPRERLGPAGSPLPLGDAWAGECRAPGYQGAVPDRAALLGNCNLGYARSACPRVPTGGADAVRWAVTRHRGDAVSICCVLERDHLPFERAALEYDAAAGRFTVPHPDPNVARQARAYIQSYLVRKQRS